MILNRLKFLWLIVIFQMFSGVVRAEQTRAYIIDFSQEADGEATPWLKSHNIDFMLDAGKLNKYFHDGALSIETEDSLAGMFGLKFEKKDYIHNVKTIRIEWGVNRFPQGADWENGNNRVPVALMFSFGDKKISSGLPFNINSAPYFLSPFIGEKENVEKIYIGKLFKRGGRYFCVSNGSLPLGETIVTEFEVNDRFKAVFNKSETPPITGYAFQMNTKETKGGASIYIRKIEFYTN